MPPRSNAVDMHWGYKPHDDCTGIWNHDAYENGWKFRTPALEYDELAKTLSFNWKKMSFVSITSREEYDAWFLYGGVDVA